MKQACATALNVLETSTRNAVNLLIINLERRRLVLIHFPSRLILIPYEYSVWFVLLSASTSIISSHLTQVKDLNLWTSIHLSISSSIASLLMLSKSWQGFLKRLLSL